MAMCKKWHVLFFCGSITTLSKIQMNVMQFPVFEMSHNCHGHVLAFRECVALQSKWMVLPHPSIQNKLESIKWSECSSDWGANFPWKGKLHPGGQKRNLCLRILTIVVLLPSPLQQHQCHAMCCHHCCWPPDVKWTVTPKRSCTCKQQLTLLLLAWQKLFD